MNLILFVSPLRVIREEVVVVVVVVYDISFSSPVRQGRQVVRGCEQGFKLEEY